MGGGSGDDGGGSGNDGGDGGGDGGDGNRDVGRSNREGGGPRGHGAGAGENLASFRVVEYSAYYRAVRRRFEARAEAPPETYPEPVEHCAVCEWKQSCVERRRADDHLPLVAGITRGQRVRLVERGVTTMAALGALDLPVLPRLDGVSDLPWTAAQ